ncbi:MAG: IS630 family transposase [Phycisphaerales bacterium]|nr:IS630 family transposase [Phycisphaerales bacterium]
MTIDGRTLSHEASEAIRKMAVRRVREGERPSEVIRAYGLCRTTIYKWLRVAKRGGEAALASRKGTGRPDKLSARQKREVRRWICGKDPRQHGFDFGLWTRKIVATLIQQKMKIRLSITSVGRLLAELNITPQKPLRRAYERDPAAIDRWKREQYPALQKRAGRRGADIFFLDEAGIRSDAPLQRTWGARGRTPVVATSGRRQSVNAISAVNRLGAFWYNVYEGRLNKEQFILFLKGFLRYRRRPVFLVLDRHPAHIARQVAEFVQSLGGRLELHFLPGYAPDLNPDEFVWNHLRQKGVSKTPLRENESLRARVEADLEAIAANPPLVRSFFRAPSVDYIMN